MFNAEMEKHDKEVVAKAFDMFIGSAKKHMAFTEDHGYQLAIKQMIDVAETIKEHW